MLLPLVLVRAVLQAGLERVALGGELHDPGRRVQTKSFMATHHLCFTAFGRVFLRPRDFSIFLLSFADRIGIGWRGLFLPPSRGDGASGSGYYVLIPFFCPYFALFPFGLPGDGVGKGLEEDVTHRFPNLVDARKKEREEKRDFSTLGPLSSQDVDGASEALFALAIRTREGEGGELG